MLRRVKLWQIALLALVAWCFAIWQMGCLMHTLGRQSGYIAGSNAACDVWGQEIGKLYAPETNRLRTVSDDRSPYLTSRNLKEAGVRIVDDGHGNLVVAGLKRPSSR